jgi:hypothetical protein
MMLIGVVWHDEYFGTVQKRLEEMGDDSLPSEIWQQMTGLTDREPQLIREYSIEDWDACGSHHNGLITRIWWGPDAHEKATELYDRLVAEGVKPEEG